MAQKKRYISMLRGVNVGAQKKVPMAELRALYIELGFTDVVSYVQSGNVVFDGDTEDTSKIKAMIEKKIEAVFGFSVSVFIRDAQDFERILSHNPFLVQRKEDPVHLYVTFLDESPHDDQWEGLKLPAVSNDEFARGKTEIFVFCPGGYGRTKISNDYFERKLRVAATTRNWNTVKALYELAIKEP